MTSISLTGIGGIVTIVELVLRLFGVEAPEGSVLAVVNGFVQLVGIGTLIYGQLRRKDLKMGMIRREV